jgi:hypothetical protein
MLWDDHLGNTNNISLPENLVVTPSGGRAPSVWYAFNQTANGGRTALQLDPAAGITTMRFTVDSKLKDQGGVGFAVQDGVVFSTSSCLTSQDPLRGRFDVAVSGGLANEFW